jgi:Tfp pilus assembly protein PilO
MHIDRPIAIAITLFVILLLMFFLVAPEYKTFKKLQIELGEKKAQFNAEFDYYAQITKAYFELQSRPEDIQKIDDALPKDPNLGATVYFLQETAKANGLVIKNVFLSKASSISAKTSQVRDIIFSMDITGSYASLGNFIISLEKSSRIFEILNISFTSSSGPPYSFTLQVKTHSY